MAMADVETPRGVAARTVNASPRPDTHLDLAMDDATRRFKALAACYAAVTARLAELQAAFSAGKITRQELNDKAEAALQRAVELSRSIVAAQMPVLAALRTAPQTEKKQ
jgi:hypothetical protein